MSICTNSPLPSIDSIVAGLKSKLTYPPVLPSLPKLPVLPSLPNPIYGSINKPNMELINIANELQSFQMQTTMMNMIKPMVSLLGISLDGFLPKIPGLGINLTTLLSMGSAQALFAAIKGAMQRGFQFPGVPSPIFPTLKIPDMEVFHTMQLVVSNYMQTVTTAIIGLIGSVTRKLKIPDMPAMPSIPSPNDVIALATQKMEAAKNAAIAKGLALSSINLNLPALFASISFPGLPAMPVLPNPLVPHFSIPHVEFVQMLTSLMNSLTTGVLVPIMNFINNTLKRFIGFTFPTICIPI